MFDNRKTGNSIRSKAYTKWWCVWIPNEIADSELYPLKDYPQWVEGEVHEVAVNGQCCLVKLLENPRDPRKFVHMSLQHKGFPIELCELVNEYVDHVPANQDMLAVVPVGICPTGICRLTPLVQVCFFIFNNVSLHNPLYNYNGFR